MFGIGKLVSGLTGGLLDKIGLGFLSPFVSMAVNFFSGNYLDLIGDVTNLVGKFTNSSFLKNLSQLNPLGSFGQGSNCFSNILSSGSSRFNLLQTTAQLLGLNKASKMLDVVGEFRNSFGLIQQNRESAHYNYLR
jgi:hypothetical protein